MLDTRVNEWFSRLQANGPSALAWVLAALIAIELARMAVVLLSGPIKSPQPVGAPTGTRARADLNVQAVVSAHLFGVAVAEPSTQDPDNAPLSSANLVLAGTIATENPKKGIAIISDSGPSQVFSVGENVNGASLYSVYFDHVILDRAGNLETLLLPRRFTGGSQSGPRHSAAEPRTAQVVQKPLVALGQVMRITVPSYDPAGKLRGFRAFPGHNRALFSELGLKPGDLVAAINGQLLDDVRHSQKVLNSLESSSSATVTVERGGNRQDISLNLGQIAAEAARTPASEGPGVAGAILRGPPPDTPAGAPVEGPQSNTAETPSE
jgi:general secretion pathway protein C